MRHFGELFHLLATFNMDMIRGYQWGEPSTVNAAHLPPPHPPLRPSDNDFLQYDFLYIRITARLDTMSGTS